MSKIAQKDKQNEIREKAKQNRLRQMELNAEKKELMRLVVDELQEHEAKVVSQQKKIRADMKQKEEQLGIEDGEERLLKAMKKIRDAQLGPDESKRTQAQIKAQ